MMLAAFVVAFAFVIASFTGFSLAAFVGTFLGAIFAVGGSANAVHAIVLTFVVASLNGLNSSGICGFFSCGVVVASGHTECESSCDSYGQKNFFHDDCFVKD